MSKATKPMYSVSATKFSNNFSNRMNSENGQKPEKKTFVWEPHEAFSSSLQNFDEYCIL
jgi:hypothetical protein